MASSSKFSGRQKLDDIKVWSFVEDGFHYVIFHEYETKETSVSKKHGLVGKLVTDTPAQSLVWKSREEARELWEVYCDAGYEVLENGSTRLVVNRGR